MGFLNIGAQIITNEIPGVPQYKYGTINTKPYSNHEGPYIRVFVVWVMRLVVWDWDLEVSSKTSVWSLGFQNQKRQGCQESMSAVSGYLRDQSLCVLANSSIAVCAEK